MNVFFVFTSADPSLGKVDKASLSLQTLMELFIEGIENKEVICGSRESPKAISQWKGLICTGSEGIIEVNLSGRRLKGSVKFAWLPPSVQLLDIQVNSLSGSLHLKELPETTVHVNAENNRFDGTICFEKLPEAMNMLCLNVNRCIGTVSLTHLPAQMEGLFISKNRFSGTIDLTRLPSGMRHLSLSLNKFEGWTDFSQLPKSMKLLYVKGNRRLKGEFIGRKGFDFFADDTEISILETN